MRGDDRRPRWGRATCCPDSGLRTRRIVDNSSACPKVQFLGKKPESQLLSFPESPHGPNNQRRLVCHSPSESFSCPSNLRIILNEAMPAVKRSTSQWPLISGNQIIVSTNKRRRFKRAWPVTQDSGYEPSVLRNSLKMRLLIGKDIVRAK